MPLIHSAKKKMRQDKKKTLHNSKIKNALKNLIKKMRREPSDKALQEVSSALDKAVKTKLIHANKASRLKSRLSKMQLKPSSSANSSGSKATIKKSAKRPAKKVPPKT